MKNREPQSITLDEMRQAINRSGYFIEQRVKVALEKEGYYVETNRAYPDPGTNTSREYDIFAIKPFRLFRGEPGGLASVIVCECQNNGQPVTFFGSDPPFTLMFQEGVKCSGLPVVVWNRNGFQSLSSVFRFETLFHQYRSPVAKQYCSFFAPRNKGGWVASHPDEQHQSFTTLVNAVETVVSQHYDNNLEPPHPAVDLQIYYPLLVLQGGLYRARQSRRDVMLREAKYVQFLRQFWRNGQPSAYQIDVIQESHLRAYLKLVDSEIRALRKRLSRRREILTVSMQRLIAQYRENRTNKTPLRHILESGSAGAEE